MRQQLQEMGKELIALSHGSAGPYSAQVALGVAQEIRADLERLERLLVRTLRDEGKSWEFIADVIGITRQAAHKRYEEPATHVDTDPAQLTIDQEQA